VRWAHDRRGRGAIRHRATLGQAERRHLALRHYQALRAALQRELEVEPAASPQALYQGMLDGRAAQDHARRSSQ
jgi:DNA-binding SARP family transcriptional activator